MDEREVAIENLRKAEKAVHDDFKERTRPAKKQEEQLCKKVEEAFSLANEKTDIANEMRCSVWMLRGRLLKIGEHCWQWNNQVVQKGQNYGSSSCGHTKFCFACALRKHC